MFLRYLLHISHIEEISRPTCTIMPTQGEMWRPNDGYRATLAQLRAAFSNAPSPRTTYIRARNQRTTTMAQDQRAQSHRKRRATKRIAAKKAATAGTPTAASKRAKTKD